MVFLACGFHRMYGHVQRNICIYIQLRLILICLYFPLNYTTVLSSSCACCTSHTRRHTPFSWDSLTTWPSSAWLRDKKSCGHVCVCVCLCVCVQECVCVCKSVCLCGWVRVWVVAKCVWGCVCTCESLCEQAYVSDRMHLCLRPHVCTSIAVCVCVDARQGYE